MQIIPTLRCFILSYAHDIQKTFVEVEHGGKLAHIVAVLLVVFF